MGLDFVCVVWICFRLTDLWLLCGVGVCFTFWCFSCRIVHFVCICCLLAFDCRLFVMCWILRVALILLVVPIVPSFCVGGGLRGFVFVF